MVKMLFTFLVLGTTLFSKGFYFLSALKKPKLIIKLIIKYGYLKNQSINMEEYEGSNRFSYQSELDFFCRALKKTRVNNTNKLVIPQRPIVVHANTISSPVDGKIISIHTIKKDRHLIVKHQSYHLSEMLYGTTCIKNAELEKYYQGVCLTLYLAPHNYHRVHHVANGTITQTSFYNSCLLPVNPWIANRVKNIYSKNKRTVISYSNVDTGWKMVLVGALNVGSIQLSFDPLWQHRALITVGHRQNTYKNLIAHKGDEAALFELGSTVLLLFQKDSLLLSASFKKVLNSNTLLNIPIKVGELLGINRLKPS